MRFGGPTSRFDLTDVEPADDVQTILEVAVDVLKDYGNDESRVTRMARWLVDNLVNEQVVEIHAGGCSRIQVPGFTEVIRSGSKISIAGRLVTAKDARAVAYALLTVAGMASKED